MPRVSEVVSESEWRVPKDTSLRSSSRRCEGEMRLMTSLASPMPCPAAVPAKASTHALVNAVTFMGRSLLALKNKRTPARGRDSSNRSSGFALLRQPRAAAALAGLLQLDLAVGLLVLADRLAEADREPLGRGPGHA